MFRSCEEARKHALASLARGEARILYGASISGHDAPSGTTWHRGYLLLGQEEGKYYAEDIVFRAFSAVIVSSPAWDKKGFSKPAALASRFGGNQPCAVMCHGVGKTSTLYEVFRADGSENAFAVWDDGKIEETVRLPSGKTVRKSDGTSIN